MKLFALTLPNGRTLLAAGLYAGRLFVWLGSRQVLPRRRPVPALAPAALVPVARLEPELRLDRGSRAGW